MNKDTVGSIAVDLLEKDPDSTNIIDIQREAQKDYIDNLEWAVKHALKKVSCRHLLGGGRGHENCYKTEALVGDFYVEVVTKKEKLMENVLKNYFFTTKTCPTPDYNQTIYKYIAATEQLIYLWTVPDDKTCEMFLKNITKVPLHERQLLDFIIKFNNGDLLRQARTLNGENLVSGIILEGA